MVTLSADAEDSLLRFLKAVAEAECDVEQARRQLADCSSFEPFSAFCLLDRYSNGSLTSSDFLHFLERAEGVDASAEVFHLVRQFDRDSDGKVSYAEFVAGILPASEAQKTVISDQQNSTLAMNRHAQRTLALVMVREAECFRDLESRRRVLFGRSDFNLLDAFRFLDRFNQGYITPEGLQTVFKECDVELLAAVPLDVASVFRRLDHDMDGRLSYAEFVDAVLPSTTARRRIMLGSRDDFDNIDSDRYRCCPSVCSPSTHTAHTQMLNSHSGYCASSSHYSHSHHHHYQQSLHAAPRHMLRPTSHSLEPHPTRQSRKSSSEYRDFVLESTTTKYNSGSHGVVLEKCNGSHRHQEDIEKRSRVPVVGKSSLLPSSSLLSINNHDNTTNYYQNNERTATAAAYVQNKEYSSPPQFTVSTTSTTGGSRSIHNGISPPSAGLSDKNRQLSIMTSSPQIPEFPIEQQKKKECCSSSSVLLATESTVASTLQQLPNHRIFSNTKPTTELASSSSLLHGSSSRRRQIVALLRDHIVARRDMDRVRQDLAMQCDFTLQDLYDWIDRTRKGFVTNVELADVMKIIGLYPSPLELDLLVNRLSTSKQQHTLVYEDFAEAFLPDDHYYADILTTRKPAKDPCIAAFSCPNWFQRSTQALLAQVLRMQMHTELMATHHTASLRNANLHDAFTELDADKDGFIGANDLKGALASYGVPVTDVDVRALISRFKNATQGKIDFNDFAKEFHDYKIQNT